MDGPPFDATGGGYVSNNREPTVSEMFEANIKGGEGIEICQL